MTNKLQCDMESGCTAPVTHFDEKGFVYCAEHGETRKSYCRCRKLRPFELRTLAGGGSIYYQPERNKAPAVMAHECEGNARTIAELMDALQAMLDEFGHQKWNVRRDFHKLVQIEAARTAIRNAKGTGSCA